MNKDTKLAILIFVVGIFVVVSIAAYNYEDPTKLKITYGESPSGLSYSEDGEFSIICNGERKGLIQYSDLKSFMQEVQDKEFVKQETKE